MNIPEKIILIIAVFALAVLFFKVLESLLEDYVVGMTTAGLMSIPIMSVSLQILLTYLVVVA